MNNLSLPTLFIVFLITSLISVSISSWDTCSTWTWKPNMNSIGGQLGHTGSCNGLHCSVCSNTYGTQNVTTDYGTGIDCTSKSKTQLKTKCFYYDLNTKSCIDGQRGIYTCKDFEKLIQCDSTACDYN
ncbi:uncharacterized protein MELLADRAFT_101696 [Melampsora larici-populina 98AG31]|uniref:Secreted protein n=1 Tax=Melampsora larici-populina (strain 98AG31 / pathotype 3-4-7) TaxID=747676 RepID=F4R6P0_MELLP|nr:uncharacterized protein MELLADRAFT_101696 [Melampsora larici-populina 98AG31]EGG12428.1 secreted protein [Melampsora larici-populina 98AG31]